MHQFLLGETKETVEDSEVTNGRMVYTASEAKLVHRIRNPSSSASRLSIDKSHLSAAESLFDIPTAITGKQISDSYRKGHGFLTASVEVGCVL